MGCDILLVAGRAGNMVDYKLILSIDFLLDSQKFRGLGFVPGVERTFSTEEENVSFSKQPEQCYSIF
jgi:hypothetical protein